MIITVKTEEDIKKLEKLLTGIVINKATFWSLHLKSNLDKLRTIGLTYWAESQKVPLSPRWAKKKAYLNGHQDEANVATGQTKEQAIFLTGSGEMYLEGKSLNSSIIATDWIPNPSKGSPPWRGLDTNRPFYTVSMIRHRLFWRPFDGYVDLKSCNKEIWKIKTTDEVSIDKAGESLIFPAIPANQVLKGKIHSLGRWKQGSNSGPAAQWR